MQLRTAVLGILLAVLVVGCDSRSEPCIPDCDGRRCGDDGCGGSCGECMPHSFCDPNGQCHGDWGNTCMTSEDCESGWCLRYSDGTGYCTMRDCLDNESCVNNAPGETAEMCCVDVGGDYRVCLKIDPGYTCGNQDKTCGQSCVGQMDSACDPSHACLSGSSVYCSHPCVTNPDCDDCQAEDPDTTFQCTVIGGGNSYCIAASDDTCTASSQCDAGQACSPYIDATGDALQGFCVSGGTLTAGAECNEDDDQCMGMCINDHCSEVCETDGDCPEQNTCMSVSFCKTMEGTGECATCAESFPDIKMCIWYPVGTQPAGAPCASGAIHADAGDCMAGLTCVVIDATNAPCTTVADCATVFAGNLNAECVPGSCGDPDHCGASFCIPPCVAEGCEDCFVVQLGDPDGCFCLPEGTSGAPGDPCPFGLMNSEFCYGSCEAGMTCLGQAADPVGMPCEADADCLAFFPGSWNVDCENGGCGMSYCAGACVAGACDPGYEPSDVNGTCYCRPSP